MSIGIIIYGIVLFICIANTSRMDDLLAKSIMWTQVVLIGLFVADIELLEIWVLVLYLLTLPAIIVYAIVKKHLLRTDKVLMTLSATFVLLANIFRIQHLNGEDILQLFGLLSIVALFLLILKGTNKVYNEIGFMFILAVVSAYGYINYLAGA